MRVQFMSDIHTEVWLNSDHGARFIKTLDPRGVDVLVLAGDIGNAETFAPVLRRFCKRYAAAKVVYVLGNHEMYGSSPQATYAAVRVVAAECPNLVFLDNDVVDIDGVMFAGSTLWFPYRPDNLLHQGVWNDFFEITDFLPWVYEQSQVSEQFLCETLMTSRVDVVVTHHLPSYRCVAAQHRGDVANRFVVNPIVERLPPNLLPPVWIFGHAHTPMDGLHHGCRFVSNPRGYPWEVIHPFRPAVFLDISPRV